MRILIVPHKGSGSQIHHLYLPYAACALACVNGNVGGEFGRWPEPLTIFFLYQHNLRVCF